MGGMQEKLKIHQYFTTVRLYIFSQQYLTYQSGIQDFGWYLNMTQVKRAISRTWNECQLAAPAFCSFYSIWESNNTSYDWNLNVFLLVCWHLCDMDATTL
jgi:hypothetical protein